MSNSGQFIAEHINNIPYSGIRRFFDIANEMEDVISLGVGEPDFETPWNIKERALYTIENYRIVYSANAGLLKLREEIAEYLKNSIGVSYCPKGQVLVTVGASEGIDLALRAVVNRGDEVLVVEPSYVSYKPCIVMAGGEPVVLETTEKTQFRLTPEILESKITNKTKAIILPYPNNPTGAIMEKADLEKIAPIIKKHNLLVISDEIYSELTYGQKHVSIASIDEMAERTIVLNGFSKAFSMTGWRLGYAVGPTEIISAMTKIHQYIIMCAPTISQNAALEAFKCLNAVDKMRQEYNTRRRVMMKGFRDIGLECFEALGAFYLFPSIKSTGLTSNEFCERLLFEEKVAVVPGTAFGNSGEGFIRCSYAYSVDDIKRAIERIAKFVDKIRK